MICENVKEEDSQKKENFCHRIEDQTNVKLHDSFEVVENDKTEDDTRGQKDYSRGNDGDSSYLHLGYLYWEDFNVIRGFRDQGRSGHLSSQLSESWVTARFNCCISEIKVGKRWWVEW